MDIELLGFIGMHTEKIENLLSADEKELVNRLANFLYICKKDPERANNIISENNIQKNIVLTPQNFIEEKPFSVFDENRHKLILGFRSSLVKLRDYANHLYDERANTIIKNKGSDKGEEVAEIGGKILGIEKMIQTNETTLRYLLLYPLIINHPKVSEDEKGQ
ncbi:MAG: hypothetical protein WC520_01775 [Candidatus Paceibacterota bacterium]